MNKFKVIGVATQGDRALYEHHIAFDPNGVGLAIAITTCTSHIIAELRKQGYDVRQYKITLNVEALN